MRGKLVISGIGKSGIVGRRMASVFSSTGTPAFFMHPTEGMHGDIGIISSSDIVMLISHSGESEELLRIIPYIKRQGARIIAVTKSKHSPLSGFADITLPTGVTREACPFNLVPTTSSAVTAALGDSLAITLLKIKGFKRSDYKNVHPAGAIGKRLLYRVEDLMFSGADVPVIREEQTLGQAIQAMSAKKNLGMVCVTDGGGRLKGILTDGDLRRLLGTGRALVSRPCRECMTKNPKVVLKRLLAVEAVSIMERHSITSLIVVDSLKLRKIAGVIHMHTILRAGVV
jgi:arabinose-5-phosphate isomerase